MSKQESTNTFSEGLVMDLNPLTTPNNVLTNALNATLITYNGNEFVLQNDLGNGRVETAKLPTGFVPLGVKEHGGIIYVASYNPITKKGQIGSFPSPERNLTQDEVSDKKLDISKSDFCEGNEIKYYYKRIDVMPEDMYLNPGDKFGLFITGNGYDLLSYYSDSHSKAVTFHPAILDDYGLINYIDEECKTDGKYTQGLIFGQNLDLSTIDGYRQAFDSLLVYKGKKSGKLVLIVEIETLDDFIVSRSVSSSKIIKNKIGSTDVIFSDDENGENAEFKVTFYNSGWPKLDNNFIKFTGIKFESNLDNFELVTDNDTISYALDKFKRSDILKYKITPYTQIGACEALSRTGIINFSLFGTGNIIFTEWRYYVENNELRLNYGFDTNLLEGESVKEVSMEFYDVYYNTVYKNKYICSSTINGNYNGNYTETFKLPYDLNYTEKYSKFLSNKDYIANNVVGIDIKNPEDKSKNLKGEYTLKSNELLKNNLYCVKITLTTTGLNNEDQTKSFFRFLWTTGYFNKEYIRNVETNFSVLQVPEEYIPKFKLKCDWDRSDSDSFKLDYKNNPTENGNSLPFIYSAEASTDKKEIKSNMYQDWELSKAEVTIATEIEAPEDNTLFGDYNSGWVKLNLGGKEITVEYDNFKQILTTPKGKVGSEPYKYVNLIKSEDPEDPEEILYKYSNETPGVGDLNQIDSIKTDPSPLFDDTYKKSLVQALRENKIDNNTYSTELEALQKINDTQFYHIENNSVSVKEEENKDPIVIFPTILGRLIRRLSGDVSNPTLDSVNLNELRPCYYKGMSQSEASVLLAGTAYDSEKVFGSAKAKAVLFGGDNKGKPNIFAFWGIADGYVNDQIELQNLEAKDGNGLSYNIIRKNLADVAGHCLIYPMQSSNYNDVNSEQWGALGIGFYTDNGESPYNSNFQDYFHEDGSRVFTFKSINYPPAPTLLLWRTTSASDSNNEFVAINLGATGSYYDCIEKCVIPLLQSICVLHKNINRELYSEKLTRMIYHSPFATVVNIGVKIDFDKESGTSSSITISKSPIKLYSGEEFKEDVIDSKLQNIGWNIKEDKWYKNLEDLSNKDIMQCSYLNIPYGKIKEVSETNEAIRDDTHLVDIDMSNITIAEDGQYILGLSLDLGGQIDMSIIVDRFESYLDGTSKYKPTLIYVPDGNSFKLIEGVDSLGNAINGNQVYYISAPGVYVPGNTSEADKVDIFKDGSHCNLKNLFIPTTLNGYTVPVINLSAASGTVEQLSTNISDHKNRKHVSDINMYRGIYFTKDGKYKPIKTN